MTEFFDRVFAELVFKLTVYVIEKIATEAGADDMVHALYERLKNNGALNAASAALRAVPGAISDRFTTLPDAARSFGQAVVEPNDVAPVFVFASLTIAVSPVLRMIYFWIAAVPVPKEPGWPFWQWPYTALILTLIVGFAATRILYRTTILYAHCNEDFPRVYLVAPLICVVFDLGMVGSCWNAHTGYTPLLHLITYRVVFPMLASILIAFCYSRFEQPTGLVLPRGYRYVHRRNRPNTSMSKEGLALQKATAHYYTQLSLQTNLLRAKGAEPKL